MRTHPQKYNDLIRSDSAPSTFQIRDKPFFELFAVKIFPIYCQNNYQIYVNFLLSNLGIRQLVALPHYIFLASKFCQIQGYRILKQPSIFAKLQNTMSIIEKLRSVFKPKAPLYKNYTHSELKVIAMKSRIQLQQHYKKCLQIIRAEDSILSERKQSPGDRYRILQEIGKHVIEVESIKIYVQFLRKIEDKCASITKTNGDIALLKTELNWFQSLLWYRKCKKVLSLQDLNSFCYNFFKGVDVTCELNPKCQIFRLYPLMLYLNPDCIITLKKIYPQITMYITTKLDFAELDQIFRINKTDIKKWVAKDQIQYHDRFLSKSKSPDKIHKDKTPKKHNQKQTNINSIAMKPVPTSVDSQQLTNSQSKVQDKQSNDANKGGSSFLRKVMESSKMKEKKNMSICVQCGSQVEADIELNSDGIPQNISKYEEAPIFAQLCKGCQTKRRLEQEQRKKQLQNMERAQHLCRACNKPMMISNQLSFSRSEQENRPKATNSFSFSQQICEQCYQKQINGKQNQNGQKTDFKIIENQQYIYRNRQNDNQNGPKQSQQVQRNETYSGLQNKQQREERMTDQQWHEDQADSIRFITQAFVQKKKAQKKPYMVSIYARAEYMDMDQLHKK